MKPEFKNLDLDNEKGTYIEEAIYALFSVNIFDIISVKAQLSKEFSIQPSELDKMPFWEFEMYLKELERLTKEENDRQKAEYDRSGAKDAMKMTKPGAMDKMMSNTMSKMPQMPNMNGKINLPGYK